MSICVDSFLEQHPAIAAARRIVQRDGVAHLTIEAVAREAGLSRGGVLYHFPTKDSLIEGMITSFLEAFEYDLAGALAQEAGPQVITGLLAPCAFVGGSRLALPQFLFAVTDTEKDGGWVGLCNLVSRRNSAHRHHRDTVRAKEPISVLKIGSLALIVLGVIGLNLGGVGH